MANSVPSRRALLVRERHLGDLLAPPPRVVPPPDLVLRWGRWALLPLASAVRVVTDDRVVSLTYDDGPHPVHTPGVLDELAARGVRATFFVLAENAERYPELIHRMLADGHEIGLHGLDHARLTSVPGLEAGRRIREAKRRLEAVTGRPVRLYRPTYGAQGMMQYLSTRLLGMDVVVWSAWALDWEEGTADEVGGRVVRALHPGAIVLLHDATDDTREEDVTRPTFDRAEVTRLILEGMADKGYRSLPAGELLAQYPILRSVTTRKPQVPGVLRGLARAQ